uniref:Uncharacterized protein n=1 Tax=Cannabis sativa TaxID=3483 RepID=A0A803NKF6_CANSA
MACQGLSTSCLAKADSQTKEGSIRPRKLDLYKEKMYKGWPPPPKVSLHHQGWSSPRLAITNQGWPTHARTVPTLNKAGKNMTCQTLVGTWFARPQPTNIVWPASLHSVGTWSASFWPGRF